MSYEYVKKYVESFGYKLLSDKYYGNDSKIDLLCPNNHVYNITFSAFKNKKRRCNICKDEEKRRFIKEYIEKNNYKLLDIHIKKSQTYVFIQCDRGHEAYWTSFSNFKNNKRRCKICGFSKAKELLKHDYYYVKDYIESIGYELLSSEYINNIKKIEIKCDYGHIFNMSFKVIKRGGRCPTCQHKIQSDNLKLSYEYVKSYIEHEGYKLLSNEYVNAHSKIKVMCNHGHTYDVKFNNFKTGYRCPICNMSSGESEVEKTLKKLNIKFISQYRFDNCEFKRKLPFDFYLPKFNCCIEFDGGQHYKIVDYFGGFDEFINIKIRDTVKNIYCKNNGIKLIRIPYWDFDNIEEILSRELIK